MGSAFAPAVITNFFSIAYSRGSARGATGGGYVLSKGAFTAVSAQPGAGPGELATSVNGDPRYSARTTRRALALLADRLRLRFASMSVDQRVDVPIGSGFGASAASATSAVYAAAAALGARAPRADLARCAYDAEIIEQTGLGTVSVTYRGTGAGAITEAGSPGVARFVTVGAPRGTRIVAASLSPYEKKAALGSPTTAAKIVKLGDAALEMFMADRTLGGLGAAGEWFSGRLGLASEDVTALAAAARRAGAEHASQNMIGHAVHAVCEEGLVPAVVKAFASSAPRPRVDVFEIGSVRAGPL